MRRTRAMAAALLLAAVGCSVVAHKGDYAAYREVRLAEDERARVLAMGEYIRAHPEGEWAPQIRARRAQLEPRLYEDNKSTAQGLRFYLEAYPDGEHAAQARERLDALGTVAERKETEREERLDAQQEELERVAEQRRNWATRAIGFWVETLLGIDEWGQPIPKVAKSNPEFDRAFGKNPRPHCSREECIKFYRLDYTVPVPGGSAQSRTIELLLRLRVEEGRLRRAEILLPDKGFSRWHELREQTLVTDADATQRQQAIEWAVSQIEDMVDGVLPEATSWNFVPEPVDPPTVRAPEEPETGASVLPGEEAEAAPEPEDGEGDEPQGEMDQLMDEAVGETGDEEAEQPPPEPETLTLPIAIAGFQSDALRLGIFAAADEDTGPAYDGVFIEVVGEGGGAGSESETETESEAEAESEPETEPETEAEPESEGESESESEGESEDDESEDDGEDGEP